MLKSTTRFWVQFLLAVMLIVAANRADAGTLVTVTFSGTGTGSSSGPFQGWFRYDQSQGGSTVFVFTSPSKDHRLSYSGSGCGTGSGVDGTAEPYQIMISGNTFTLQGTAPKSPATTITIVLPTNESFTSTNPLPLCAFGPSSTPVS